LTLGRAGIATQENVDLTADFRLVVIIVLARAAEQQTQDALFDVVVLVDARRWKQREG
jgi:hypothetical protein